MDNNELYITACSILFRNSYANQNIKNIQVRSLRNRFIVTGEVEGHQTRKVYLADSIELRNITTTHPSSEDSSSGSNEFAVCCGCEEIGLLGHLCTSQECIDSGNIFTNPLPNNENSTQESSSITSDYATCTGCNEIGLLGHLCTTRECTDSGNIFADPVNNEE